MRLVVLGFSHETNTFSRVPAEYAQFEKAGILKQFTGEEPMCGLVRDLGAVLDRPGMLAASFAEGYPYADVPEMGMAFLAVHDAGEQAAQEAARWLAERAWERRALFVGQAPSPTEALLSAASARKGPVVLMDVGDNVGGGSPGDSTILLAEAKRVVVAKGVVSPRPAYEPIAAQIVLADTPGVTTADLSRFTYHRRRRPLFPFEPEAVYSS